MNPAASKIRAWRKDVVLFARECLDFEPDGWQRKVMQAWNDGYRRIAMQACKGPGKTALLAVLVWHFLACFPHAKVVATSITGDNLRDGLWTELALWQNKSPFLKAAFNWAAERITAKDHPETWYASARKWAQSADKTKQAETLAGLHGENLLFVIDEAGGVPDAVAAAADAGLSTGGNTRMVIAGNPAQHSGPLFRAATEERHKWFVVEISGDPADPDRASRIDAEWAQDQIDRWGRDHPWVMTNVLGKYPPQASNQLIGDHLVRAARERDIPKYAQLHAPRIMGVDVAWAGSDRSVIAFREGPVMFAPKILRIPDVMDLASAIGEAINKWKPHAVFIDLGGLPGVTHRLQQLGHHQVIGVHFGGKATGNESERFKNKRAEMWHALADWFRNGSACLPSKGVCPEIEKEVTKMTFFMSEDKTTRIQLLDKEEFKAEHGFSPDIGDAMALTFAEPVAMPVADPRHTRGLAEGTQKARTMKNPYERLGAA